MAKSDNPLKRGTRIIPQGKTQINVNVPDEVLLKLRSIGDHEGVAYAEVYNMAFSKFVELYEKKNGKVKAKQKGMGLMGL